MLDNTMKSQLAAYLERLVDPIELVATLDTGSQSSQLRELLEDIAGMTDRIHLRLDGKAARTPSFTIARVGETARVSFAGIPLGHEFSSLVLALLQVSGYPPKLADETIARIRALPDGLQFTTWISLSCHNCPEVVQSLNTIAALHPGIEHQMVDGALFQSEVEALGIMAVPAVMLAEEPFGNGRMELEEILDKLDAGNVSKAPGDNGQPYDVLIIGGGPAGASAAIYAARKGIRTGILAERFGGQVQDTLAIENLISVPQTDGPKLVRALEQHVREYNVEIMNRRRVESLLPAGSDGLHSVRVADGSVYRARSVIVSTGARWRELNVPGEQEYRGKGVAYCPHCDGPLFKGKHVAVVGGGNSGVEAAIDLAGIVGHVTLLEYGETLKADAVLQSRLNSLANVTVIRSAQTTAITGDGVKVDGLAYTDRVTGESRHIDLQGVFVQIGLLPNTDWLKGTVKLNRFGEIEIDDRGQTSVPGVFAAGDCTTVPYKQIIIAMGEGSRASLSAFDHLIRTPVQAAA